MSKKKSRRERAKLAAKPEQIKPAVISETEYRQLKNQLEDANRKCAAMEAKYGPLKGRAVLAFLYNVVSKNRSGDGVEHEKIETFFLDDANEQVRGRNYLKSVKKSIEESWKKRALNYTEEDGTKGAAPRHDQFRTAEGARKAYKGWCKTRDCETCIYRKADVKTNTTCFDRWLYGKDSDNEKRG